jgi:two-component system sensor histidine kinase ChvG
MASAALPRVIRWLQSIRVQAFVLAVILIALPPLILTVLGNADAERHLLILNAVADTGEAIVAGMAPVLHDLRPADVATLKRAMSRLAAPDRSIKILLRPASAETAQGFYFVAIEPPIAAEQAEAERQELLALGILPGLSQGCTARPLRDRRPSLLGGGAEALTAATSVDGVAGCWAVVVATGESRVLGAIEPLPYWARREVCVAMAIYALMAVLIAAIFGGVWHSLHRFHRLALSPTDQAGFAMMTNIPELASLASAFDRMVQRMRHSAEMLRQAAEDNAHAFKGPIGTIRQAIERPLRHGSPDTAEAQIHLHTVSAALNRLDGLVRSARYLDSAAAELLEPHQSQVDLSALVRGFVESYATAMLAPQVRIEADVAEGVVVTGQSEPLEVILENLVDNAIGFSPAGGRLAIRLEIHHGQAIMSVEDDGPGIAPDRLDRIFDRYYTDRPADKSSLGHTDSEQHFGVGLWLVRQNTMSLGGQVSAFNRKPRGLRVTVALPISNARQVGEPKLD